MNIRFGAAIIAAALAGGQAHSEVFEINQVGLSFSPNEVVAAPGDTLRFLWDSGTHTVTSGTNCTAGSVNGFSFNEPLTSTNPVVEIVIPKDFHGELGFLCDIGQHCSFGMNGVALVPRVIEIQQVGLSFSPSEVSADPGDILRFLHDSGSHSVTSGFKCTEGPVNGLSLNEPLTAGNPVVDIAIPGDFTGELGFFCDIGQHCSFGMEGVAIVGSPALPGDFNGDGSVDGADLGLLLSAFGTINATYDLNGDTFVDGADIGLFLALFTA